MNLNLSHEFEDSFASRDGVSVMLPLREGSEPFHVQLLRSQLAERKRKNPHYSLRGFSRQLGLHPSALCRILGGKQQISARNCQRILESLTLAPDERKRFLESTFSGRRGRLGEFVGENETVATPKSDATRKLTRAFHRWICARNPAAQEGLKPAESRHLENRIVSFLLELENEFARIPSGA